MPRTGEITLDGELLPPRAEEVVRRGVALVPQGRRIFPTMTVEENLFMGAYAVGGTWKDAATRFAPVYETFPRLAERRNQTASSLSGGEQQMLVIGRALLSNPSSSSSTSCPSDWRRRWSRRCSRPSCELNRDRGTACVLVEQAASAALSISNTAYLLRKGEVVYSGPAERLRSDTELLHGRVSRQEGDGRPWPAP